MLLIEAQCENGNGPVALWPNLLGLGFLKMLPKVGGKLHLRLNIGTILVLHNTSMILVNGDSVALVLQFANQRAET